MTTVTSLLAENSLFHSIGQIFHPVFVLFATILAGIYAVIPNYAISIVILTLLVMAVLTPLTVKSTKSMIAMQEIQPEIKKLQQKYKGAENRQQLNEEMMRLYKERGINPAGGCLPMLLQMPFLIILYDLIRGLTNTVTVHGHLVAEPRYISHGSQLYKNLIAHPGQMNAFGMNLADKPFSPHPSIWAAIPFFVLVVAAVALQYFQMAQMTRRNPQAAQANKQMQMMQKFMPLLMAYIYFLVPAAVVIYMIVSTIIRIATQDVMFRMGIVKPAKAERKLPGGASGEAKQPLPAPGPTAPAPALAAGPSISRLFRRRGSEDDETVDGGNGAQQTKGGAAAQAGTPSKSGGARKGGAGGGVGKAGAGRSNGTSGSAKPAAAGNRSGPKSPSGKGRPAVSGGGPSKRNGRKPAPAPTTGTTKPHPRSKSKRERKAR